MANVREWSEITEGRALNKNMYLIENIGVLSPILFAVYIDGMLERLKESCIGCYLCNSYVGGLAFAHGVYRCYAQHFLVCN